ncbi:diguanylate cyclase [uncultured Litoreibacter sp.]|uniref:diguanylate cyclase n=1 Tax=uncultured Litoreibacter sp. TaxID=1392394 RepID=UPI002616DC07|nr:diguanylate cyclase [uncultured Litoreibacter sp.]
MAGRILIIDPLPTNRMVLKAKLSLAHYDVNVADGVDQARELTQTHLFEAILISSALVDFTENCVLTWMTAAQQQSCAASTFIFMHDFAQSDQNPELLEQCLNAGADDVLTRPFTEDVLLARIRNLMRDNAYNRELNLPALQQGLSADDQTPALAPPTHTVIAQVSVTDTPRFSARVSGYLHDLNQCIPPPNHVKSVPLSLITQPDPTTNEPDVVLLVAQNGATERALLVMSQLLSRARMQDVRVIVVLETPSPKQTARAFDMGAHDVLALSAAPSDTATRIQVQANTRFAIRSRKNVVREGLRLAVIDPLTGLYNRRYAASRLQEIQRDCLSARASFAVLAFDVDHFKVVNDRYGHSVGDVVLTTLAETLRKNLRDEDLICRTGGEEFLVALPKTDSLQATATANRLRQLVGAMDIAVEGQSAPLQVTVSVGLSIQNGQVPISDMLEQADRALYQAKARGRNVVAIATAA